MQKTIKLLKLKLKNKVKLNVPLKTLTSLKIGGNCKCLIEACNLEDIFYTLKIVSETKCKFFVLGNGTNILASDNGFNGVILKIGAKFSYVECKDNVICAYAGASLNKVCNFAQENSLSGMENLYGIPGSCGGACYMNAGAFGTEISDVLKCAYVYVNGKVTKFAKKDLNFNYRYSILKNFNNPVVLMLEFELFKADKFKIKQNMKNVISKRINNQPLNYPSAGSVFKKKDDIIVSKLLDKDGLKGYNINDACVSEKHAGFIINKGCAKSRDVFLLIEYIKHFVYKKHKVLLQEEIEYLGDF